MTAEPTGDISWASIGGLSQQIREVREVLELPLKNPELFQRVGIAAPKGVLLYGPPGTGKTLLAKAAAATMNVSFLRVVGSAIVDKYIGESARVIREMFAYARDHKPCIIFMDELDSIGGKRLSEGTSADREIQRCVPPRDYVMRTGADLDREHRNDPIRTLMELLNELDGFDTLSGVTFVGATNRPDTLDPALLRPGRLDRKVEVPLPNELGRVEILKIHASKMSKSGEIDYEAIAKLCEGYNGADLRNVCTEAGMFAIREDRDYATHDDFIKAARKLQDYKKNESKLDYAPV